MRANPSLAPRKPPRQSATDEALPATAYAVSRHRNVTNLRNVPADHLRARELVPFKAAIESDVAVIMTGHVQVPSLDAERPATLSRAIVHDLLRGELGYRGLVATDDLDMRAIAGTYGIGEAVVRAVGATVDLLLLCGPDAARQHEALEALVHAAERGELSMPELEASLGRHRRAKERYLAEVRGWRPDERVRDQVGRTEFLAVADEMARHG